MRATSVAENPFLITMIAQALVSSSGQLFHRKAFNRGFQVWREGSGRDKRRRVGPIMVATVVEFLLVQLCESYGL